MSGLGNGLYTTGTGQIVTINDPNVKTNTVHVNGSLVLGYKDPNNSSSDLEDWEVNEMRKFIKWFVNMHYPEAIEQFLAIRKIERANEEQAKLEERQRWYEKDLELQKQLQARVQQAYGNTLTQQKSIWDRMKEMAGYRKTEHGDYY